MRRRGSGDDPRDVARAVSEAYEAIRGNGHNPGGHNVEGVPTPLTGAALRTDVGNGERFANRYRGKVMHSAAAGGWLVYDGMRWKRDEENRVQQLAKQIPHDIWSDATAAFAAGDENENKALTRWANQSRQAPKIDAMLKMARSEPGIPVRAEELDKDRWLLNCENGTIDLKTGGLNEHDPLDRITRLCPVAYDPNAPAPTWHAFLERVLPSEPLRRFVQKLVGCWLTGDVSEQILAFFYGTGANGKTTLINAVLSMLGDYAQEAAPDLLVVKRGTHPTELAELRGRRFVAAVEADADARMAENLIKQLTGGDRIRARFMRQDFFEFDPTHKVLLAANHKPAVRGTDHAIWRRIRLVPFDVTIPDSEKDKDLPSKLLAELPGILAWAVRGCMAWQREGLGEPEEVRAATQTYRDEMDTLANFIEECCIVSETACAPASRLYKAYEKWCAATGETAETQTRFGMRLGERGFVNARATSGPRKGTKEWHGIGLVYTPDPDGDGAPSEQLWRPEPGKRYESSASVPPNGERLAANRSPEKTLQNSGKPGDKHTSGEQGEAVSGINATKNTLVEVMPQSGPPYSLRSPEAAEERTPKPEVHPKAERLTEAQAHKVQRLISEGIDPKTARDEVLGARA